MRRNILLSILLLSSISCMLAQNPIYQKYAGKNGITAVYISKSMLGMVSGMNINANGVDINKVASRLTGIYIINTEEMAYVNKLKEESKSLFHNKSYETLMQVNDNGETVTFLGKTTKKDNFSDLLILSEEPHEFSLIQLVGNMTLQEIKNITQK